MDMLCIFCFTIKVSGFSYTLSYSTFKKKKKQYCDIMEEKKV